MPGAFVVDATVFVLNRYRLLALHHKGGYVIHEIKCRVTAWTWNSGVQHSLKTFLIVYTKLAK